MLIRPAEARPNLVAMRVVGTIVGTLALLIMLDIVRPEMGMAMLRNLMSMTDS